MKNFGIQEPCNENWANMTPTQKGAFCQQCTKQVIDFTNKSTDYIKSTLLKNKGESLCGRMTIDQEIDLQNNFVLWQQTSHQRMRRISLFAFILVFGLSIVSCADEQDKQTIQQLHHSTMKMIENESTSEINYINAGNSDEILIEKVSKLEGKSIDEIVQEESVIEKDVNLEEIQIIQEHQYITMGIMVIPNRYEVEYLEETTSTRYDENGIAIPTEFSAIAYPNPTKDFTILKFEAPDKVKASIMLYDMNGTLVREIENRKFEAGTHNISIDLTENKPGTYLIYVVSKEFKESLRVVKID